MGRHKVLKYSVGTKCNRLDTYTRMFMLKQIDLLFNFVSEWPLIGEQNWMLSMNLLQLYKWKQSCLLTSIRSSIQVISIKRNIRHQT